MNLSTSASPKSGSQVTLWDHSYEGSDERWVVSFTVEVNGFGGENMDGEPFHGHTGTIAEYDEARRIANTVYRLIKGNMAADEAFAAATGTSVF